MFCFPIFSISNIIPGLNGSQKMKIRDMNYLFFLQGMQRSKKEFFKN